MGFAGTTIVTGAVVQNGSGVGGCDAAITATSIGDSSDHFPYICSMEIVNGADIMAA